MRRRVFLLLALSLLLLPHAAAADDLAEEYGFETNSLDEIMAQFMASYGLNEGNFSVAYYATGDHAEYRFADDTYRVAGSLFKVPLNMYYYDLERTGAISQNLTIGGWSLSTLHRETIVNSNNDMAISMLYHLGSFRQYRELMTRFCDQDYPAAYYADNNINAGYMLAVLKQLYENQDDYAELIGYMKQGAPGQYFQHYVDEYDVAHKYGYFEGAVNDCAIIFTPEPFLLTALTQDVACAEIVLGRLAELLTAYTVYQTESRAPAPEPEPEPEREPHAVTVVELPESPEPPEPPENADAAAPDPAAQPDPASEDAMQPEDAQQSAAPWIAVAAVAALALIVIALRAKKRVRT